MIGIPKALRLLRRLYVDSGLRSALPHGLKSGVRRRAWLPLARLAGYPISSPRVPRPPLPRHRVPARLGRVLIACDLNHDYLDFWPAARRAWLEVVGVEPLLVLVAAREDIPPELASDELVVPFEPLDELHTAFQAQCIRLLYPALLETPEAVLISDIDLYPLRPSYFRGPLEQLDRRFFVSYRDERLWRGEVDMNFNAALPATWSELFHVDDLDDVRRRLREWSDGLVYDGRRGWDGWYTDQRVLHRSLTAWVDASTRWWVLDDEYCRHNQLERLELAREDGLLPHRRAALRRQEYSEFICLVPYRAHRDVNDLVLELGIAAAASHR